MSSTGSDSEKLASSLHRTVLGGLLAMLGILGVGMARGLLTGDYLLGIVGLVFALGAGFWILSLFLEGLRER